VRALVIGGTGPTGPFIVNGLRARGFRVSMLHTGRHERPEIPDDVVHVHTDPYDAEALSSALDGLGHFDVCVATYGRLRRIAELLVGRCGKFVSIGGFPAYHGYMNPYVGFPAGLPVPTREDAPRVTDPSHDEKGYRIARTEDQVFALHPDATHLRYPYVYGPHQLVPREWCIVRRILDGRPHIVLADDGLTLASFGYVENLAHAVLLAVDHAALSAGQVYNCADEEVLTIRQVVEIAATALDHVLEIVSMPWTIALPARPLLMQPRPSHRVVDVAKLRTELGYRDVVPAREAVALTARWLAANPPPPGGLEETVLQDPFDYAAEDALIAAWRAALASMPRAEFDEEPGYGLAYSGPGGRSPSKREFE